MNILSFDIEDWFHINFDEEFNDEVRWNDYTSRIESNTDFILEVLEIRKIRATFFCLGWVARKYPALVRRIHENGHDIGSHSDIHNLVNKLNRNEFEIDLKKSISSLEDVTGSKIKIFRAPAFSIGKSNLWAFEVLLDNGIEIDCSIFPANHHFGGFPEMNIGSPFLINYKNSLIKEFPVSTYNFLGKAVVLTGGGYFRFFPYYFIRKYIENSDYVFSYFHPRDFDVNQPLLNNISYIRKFKSYYGLKHSLKKFTKLMSEFEFINVSNADKIFDWNKSETIYL